MIDPADIDARIARNARAIAAGKRIWHKDIAAEIGISVWTFSHLMNGQQRWDAYHLIGAAIALDVPIERLLQ